ncbi:MAG: 2,3-bisphosphoglycerate-independent phosphoglycerate mutase [Marinobacter sp.]|nr:2,3-bisphosphoglycerate-independent phosphoglycerate mutase [Marinobacter sp.]
MKKTQLLVILDGWGTRTSSEYNAISAAQTPVWDQLLATCPNSQIATSGNAVGLPDGQMGNSEVGHMNLGAGRTVFQNFTRINNAIADGEFAGNPALTDLIDGVVGRRGTLHVLGLLSAGGVHSHRHHLEAMCRVAADRGVERVLVHGFLDGRDTPPRCAEEELQAFEEAIAPLSVVRVASLVGRYYAMDRDNRWDRIEKAYQLIATGQGEHRAASAAEAVQAAYERDENDEFVMPTVIAEAHEHAVPVAPEDGFVFMNFRPDRARQMSRALTDPAFDAFERPIVVGHDRLVTLTQYADDIPCKVAFPPVALDNSLGEVIASQGGTQLRIAETEKYAHVTFFFNGGQEQPFEGEERILVPSPRVASYDLQPEMSAPEVTEKLVSALQSKRFDLIVCNYANGDMVGHTGNMDAAIKAVETLDTCIGQIVDAVRETGADCLITADHGNVEKLFDAETGQAHTAHTLGTVPLVYVGSRSDRARLRDGSLRDIAPTLLDLMPVAAPEEMNGRSLLAWQD